jgi:hypothetical protein
MKVVDITVCSGLNFQAEGDSAVLWSDLAVAYFMWWQALVKAMHTPDAINTFSNAARVLARKSGNRQASTDMPTASTCLQVCAV